MTLLLNLTLSASPVVDSCVTSPSISLYGRTTGSSDRRGALYLVTPRGSALEREPVVTEQELGGEWEGGHAS